MDDDESGSDAFGEAPCVLEGELARPVVPDGVFLGGAFDDDPSRPSRHDVYDS
jgi:hypothetical protein